MLLQQVLSLLRGFALAQGARQSGLGGSTDQV
jgi:hypothetical protein